LVKTNQKKNVTNFILRVKAIKKLIFTRPLSYGHYIALKNKQKQYFSQKTKVIGR